MLKIELDGKGPIYRQIVEQVLAQIKDGQLKPGDRLPTERELSSQLLVARGTVQKAYRELSDNNIIEMIQGSGSYIYNDKSLYDTEQRKLALELIAQTLDKLEHWNLSSKEISLLIRMSLAKRIPSDHLVRIALVDCNPESLSIFKRQLSYIPGIVISVFLIESIILDDDPGHFLTDYDLVLTTITHYEQLEKSLRPVGIKPIAVDVAPSRQTIVSISTLPQDCSVGIICQSNKFANLITQQYSLFRGKDENLPIYFEADVQHSIKFMKKLDAVIVSPDLPLLDPSVSGAAIEEYLASGKKIITFDYMIGRGSMQHVEEIIDQRLQNKK
ncbi:MAG: GntR family transcriptional regulator [Clostridiaceae bacterium]|nr:GntR family transcriptional regulator [Clostridiaceae bacterium]